jgi:outer membrane murein-binding lipoprotein Lpp
MSPNEIIYALQSWPAKIAELNELLKADRAELAAAKAECDLNRTRLASIFWSGAMDKFTGGDVQKWAADYTAELARLRALSDQLSDNLSAVGAAYNAEKARAEKAEAECLEQARLLGKSAEREADLLGKLGRLESELAAIKNGHGELGKYEQLRLKNAELQAELAAIKGTP